jgi:hypothetical protein
MSTVFVGCKLPHGHIIEHHNTTITLAGANAGFDANSPWKSGAAPDSALRVSGAGLTRLEGAQADAYLDWYEMSSKGEGPVASGMIFHTARDADTRKEAQGLESETTGLDPLDPAKDLPKGLSTNSEE